MSLALTVFENQCFQLQLFLLLFLPANDRHHWVFKWLQPIFLTQHTHGLDFPPGVTRTAWQ